MPQVRFKKIYLHIVLACCVWQQVVEGDENYDEYAQDQTGLEDVMQGPLGQEAQHLVSDNNLKEAKSSSFHKIITIELTTVLCSFLLIVSLALAAVACVSLIQL